MNGTTPTAATPGERAGSLRPLIAAVRACRLCEAHLPLGPKPLLQLHAGARLLIAGQAPGRVAHLSGTPFDDASGDRLRSWLGIDRATFYDARRVALLPMGFCYPGSGASGDLAPRPECAPAWRALLLGKLRAIELTLVIGRYAIDHHLPGRNEPLTETVRAWRKFWPSIVPLPHPSPRNQGWVRRNPWFARELLPALRKRVAELLVYP